MAIMNNIIINTYPELNSHCSMHSRALAWVAKHQQFGIPQLLAEIGALRMCRYQIP